MPDQRPLDAQTLRLRQQNLREALPLLIPLAEKVARVHGHHEPTLIAVSVHLAELADSLVEHLEHEEEADFGRAEAEKLKAEHARLLGVLERLRVAAADYEVPEWACRSYATLMRGLERLDGQLSRQVELEEQARSQGAPA